MNVGSLFSGIGGLDLGLARAGFRHAFFCEDDPDNPVAGEYRRAVLREHFPGVPVYGDVRDLGSSDDGAWAAGGGMDDERWEEAVCSPPLTVHSQGQRTLISSSEASPVKTSPSPDEEPGSQATAPASSSSLPGSQSLFDLDGYSSRTFQVSSLQTAVGTSESCLERWPTSGTAWRGGLSTHVSSECRSDDGGCSSSEPSLTEILEPPQGVPARFSLSARAALGILKRAEKRGRTLPQALEQALQTVAGTTADSTGGGTRPCRASATGEPMTTTRRRAGS